MFLGFFFGWLVWFFVCFGGFGFVFCWFFWVCGFFWWGFWCVVWGFFICVVVVVVWLGFFRSCKHGISSSKKGVIL